MALLAKRVHIRLKLLAVVLVMMWSSSTQRRSISATAMTIDQAISAAAAASVQERLSQREQVSYSQPNGVRVELDMIVNIEDLEAMKRSAEGRTGRRRRIALRNVQYRWPDAVIPYQLNLTLTDDEMKSFKAALEDYHQFTCLRFREASSRDSTYVKIVSDVGCYSRVGRQLSTEPQTLSLSAGCRHKSTIIHELARAIGIRHEQSRPDRDDFVTIRNENIQEDMHHNFVRFSSEEVDTRGIPYDYLSVMHYGSYYFSNNGGYTIVTNNATYQSLIGKAPGFSFRDVKLINAIYNCSDKNHCRKKNCPSEGFVGQGCHCWCPSGSNTIAAVKCPGCQDYNEFCHDFKMRGLCTKRLFSNYMRDVCPRACGVCP